MDMNGIREAGALRWEIAPTGTMRVPAVLFGDRALLDGMDDKVREQLQNVARLPGIVGAAYAMPDAHWGYGFPIGGVAAFDPERGGIVSAGGVGFDISCGVRSLNTSLRRADVLAVQDALAHELGRAVPAGLGSTGRIRLGAAEFDDMLVGGARWAVERGWGESADLARIEGGGQLLHAKPGAISERARHRQRDEMGTLGSGNHYLEVQVVTEVFEAAAARAFGLEPEGIVVTIHCGSRGLGHQVGTEYLKEMVFAAPAFGLQLPDRELACAPVRSDLGQRYLGAMRAAGNCAMANRQVITALVREAMRRFFPGETLPLLYDVSHNLCREELHEVDGAPRRLYVHRKGATRALGPGAEEVPAEYRAVGQPVLIGGSMGTASYVLAGAANGEALALASACHGAGRCMSRHAAARQWRGRQVAEELRARGIVVVSPTTRGIAEEAPGAYKPIESVVDAADRAGLARKVARLEPLIVLKG